jgi:hypothetical protein
MVRTWLPNSWLCSPPPINSAIIHNKSYVKPTAEFIEGVGLHHPPPSLYLLRRKRYLEQLDHGGWKRVQLSWRPAYKQIPFMLGLGWSVDKIDPDMAWSVTFCDAMNMKYDFKEADASVCSRKNICKLLCRKLQFCMHHASIISCS